MIGSALAKSERQVSPSCPSAERQTPFQYSTAEKSSRVRPPHARQRLRLRETTRVEGRKQRTVVFGVSSGALDLEADVLEYHAGYGGISLGWLAVEGMREDEGRAIILRGPARMSGCRLHVGVFGCVVHHCKGRKHTVGHKALHNSPRLFNTVYYGGTTGHTCQCDRERVTDLHRKHSSSWQVIW
jgi:hypothetical protein